MLYDVNFARRKSSLESNRVFAGQIPPPTCRSIAIWKIGNSGRFVADCDIVRGAKTRGHFQYVELCRNSRPVTVPYNEDEGNYNARPLSRVPLEEWALKKVCGNCGLHLLEKPYTCPVEVIRRFINLFISTLSPFLFLHLLQ